ncbi:Uncharacterised protein [Streptococcus pneumoniae]|nr:Uncharacterised protein [Streptococcus pneumoniae]
MKMLVKYLILCYSESMDFFSRMILDILIAITCSLVCDNLFVFSFHTQ